MALREIPGLQRVPPWELTCALWTKGPRDCGDRNVLQEGAQAPPGEGSSWSTWEQEGPTWAASILPQL